MDESERAALAEQYADAENLDARVRLHEQYDTADRGWWQWMFDRVDAPDDADVLEVGCGPGYLWRDVADRVPSGWDLLLSDFSPGMVGEARETLAEAGLRDDGADGSGAVAGENAAVEPHLATAAAESLPLPDDSVDVVLACHMLYHVDREAALPEIRRVLRPGGRLYATTNGESNLRQLRDLLGAVSDYEAPPTREFSLESGGAELAAHFERVERVERDSELRVTDLEPLVAYAGSLPGVGRAELDGFAERAAPAFDDGPLRIEKHMGMFVARAD
jgi:ubiquinone/menaquinone biosynthesis C-methylase UbiE